MSSMEKMDWVGTWRNQYGSTVAITSSEDGKIEGIFKTAIKTSSIWGEEVPIVGVCHDDLISFSAAGARKKGGVVVAFTGKFSEGRLQTVWQLVSARKLSAEREGEQAVSRPLEWPHAVMTNADVFERVT